MKIAYIAGAPRSGSTLIDRVLGGMKSVAGLGEMVLTLEKLSDNENVCACHKELVTCPVWGKIIKILPDEFSSKHQASETEALRFAFEGRGGLIRIMCSRFFPQSRKNYIRIWSAFWDCVENTVGNFQVIVDSSKSEMDAIWRPLALTRLLHKDVYVVHIVRDLRGALYSDIRGSNVMIEKGRQHSGSRGFLRTCYQWIRVNLSVRLLAWLMPSGRYLYMRYEDLVSCPQEAFRRITEFLGLDAEQAYTNLSSSEVRAGGHQIYGNRMRFRKFLHIKPDIEWKTALPWTHKLIGALFNLLR